MTQRSTDDTMAWLRYQHASGSRAWQAKCLMLQRMARGLPAVNPTALSAAEATPEADRVYDIDKVRRGMVAYFDDPNDGNPAGHVAGVAGRNDAGTVLTWTNDAKHTGGVDLTRYDFFPKHWGDRFLFAATSLNGFDLDLPDRPKPKKKPPIGKSAKHFDLIVHGFELAIRVHERRHHTALVRELRRELREIEATRKEYSK